MTKVHKIWTHLGDLLTPQRTWLSFPSSAFLIVVAFFFNMGEDKYILIWSPRLCCIFVVPFGVRDQRGSQQLFTLNGPWAQERCLINRKHVFIDLVISCAILP